MRFCLNTTIFRPTDVFQDIRPYGPIREVLFLFFGWFQYKIHGKPQLNNFVRDLTCLRKRKALDLWDSGSKSQLYTRPARSGPSKRQRDQHQDTYYCTYQAGYTRN